MRIKKYIAPNIAEAMKQIRKELGAEAVILNSRETKKGGFLGLFKKKQIEVIAGIDPDPLPQKPTKMKEEKVHPDISKVMSKNEKETEVLQEIKQLKRFIEIQTQNATGLTFPLEYELLHQHLLEQEVNPTLAKKIIEELVEEYGEDGLDKDDLKMKLKMTVEKYLEPYSFDGLSRKKKVIQFVGPTGVGKTTTLAKLASQLILNENKRIAFITTDTYRIAAVEQLKTYAQILQAPLEVAYTVEDYKQAIEKYKSFDFILVDTAGRNFREEKYVKDLMKMIDPSTEMETFLVLSLTAKPNDIMDIYDQFQHVPMKEVIFTKIDETRQFGSMLNICAEKKIGIAYLTNGQDVPKDMIKANRETIANLIVGEMSHE